ncbi:MAG: hypothetical protein ABR616_18610 [Dermatophilaceae bacterium]
MGPTGLAGDDDDAVHHHVQLDDDEVASLTSRLHRRRAETPVSPELAEIAAAWQQIDAEIDAIDIRRRSELLRCRDPLEQDRATPRNGGGSSRLGPGSDGRVPRRP